MDEHLCPQKDCGEVLSRNKKGDFPQFCPECNGPTGLGKDSRIYCPDPECGELLKKNKKGVYPKHCPECNGLTETVDRPTGEKALLCPNVICGVPLSKSKEGLYPRFCSECGCAIERRTGLQAPISSELVMGCRRDNEDNSTHRTSDRQKYDSQTAHSESTEGNIDKQLSNPTKPDQEETSMPQTVKCRIVNLAYLNFNSKLELERQKIRNRKTDIFTEMISPWNKKESSFRDCYQS